MRCKVSSGEPTATNEISAIVDQAIAHTDQLLESSAVEWEVACVGLMKLRDALAGAAPGHPALERLRTFIAKRAGRRRDQ
jgi:hypothetical protein